MGNVVFSAPLVEGPDGKIRAYHHTSAKKSHSHCLLLVSLRDYESLVTIAGSIRRRYVIEPVGGLRSSRLALNGVPVEEDLVFAWGRKSTKRKYRVARECSRCADGRRSFFRRTPARSWC